MSTFTELAETKTSVTISPKESLEVRKLNAAFNYIFIGFLIYISGDSAWWTFVTGLMFIIYSYLWIAHLIGKNTSTFETIDDAIEYLNKEKGKE